MINNLEAYARSQLWNWHCLDGCFGDTKIMPTDFDAVIERNGCFLIFEVKAPGVPVKQGQMLTLRNLARKPGFTIFFVWGHPNAPETLQILDVKGLRDPIPCDMDTLRRYVRLWFEYVEKRR